jgi:hypothetical protein
MARHLSALIILSLVLSGCASAPPPSKSGRFAWDGLGQDPNRLIRHKRRPTATGALTAVPKAPEPNAERDRVLATLRPYSAAWWAVQDEIDAEEQRRIKAKLVICRSCFPKTAPDEFTASVRQ